MPSKPKKKKAISDENQLRAAYMKGRLHGVAEAAKRALLNWSPPDEKRAWERGYIDGLRAWSSVEKPDA